MRRYRWLTKRTSTRLLSSALRFTVTPLVHTHGMSTTEPEHPLQLMLLPTSDLPECLRIDDVTRITGLRHISELRAELEHRRMARNAAQPAA